MDAGTQLSRSHELSTKVALLLQKRVKVAQEQFNERVQNALENRGQPKCRRSR